MPKPCVQQERDESSRSRSGRWGGSPSCSCLDPAVLVSFQLNKDNCLMVCPEVVLAGVPQAMAAAAAASLKQRL